MPGFGNGRSSEAQVPAELPGSAGKKQKGSKEELFYFLSPVSTLPASRSRGGTGLSCYGLTQNHQKGARVSHKASLLLGCRCPTGPWAPVCLSCRFLCPLENLRAHQHPPGQSGMLSVPLTLCPLYTTRTPLFDCTMPLSHLLCSNATDRLPLLSVSCLFF